MSRIGKKLIDIPAGVKVNINNDVVKVEWPKGSLVQQIEKEFKAEISDNKIKIIRTKIIKIV